jgi:hypothetical protein
MKTVLYPGAPFRFPIGGQAVDLTFAVSPQGRVPMLCSKCGQRMDPEHKPVFKEVDWWCFNCELSKRRGA